MATYSIVYATYGAAIARNGMAPYDARSSLRGVLCNLSDYAYVCTYTYRGPCMRQQCTLS